jgi:cobalt-zinc-cadmium efflux system outer membrane protein
MRVTLLAALAAMGWAVSPPVMAQSASPALTLEDAVARSLEASPLLNARDAAIAASGASIDQAGVRPNPQIEVEIENFTGSGPYSDFGSTETTVTYRQPLERGGKRRARVALAEAERGIARLERVRSAAEVAFETQQAWNAAQVAAALVVHGEERLQLAEEIAAIVHRRVRAARDPLAAGLKADNQVADARAGLDQARRTLDAAREALMAQWAGESSAVAIDGAAFFAMVDGPDGIGAPDLAVSEAQIDRAGKSFELEKARAKQDPTIGIGMRRFEDGGDVAGVVSFSLPLTFFDRNRGNIDRAMAERQEAQWMLAETQRKQAAALRAARSAQAAARAEAAAIRDDMIPRATEAARSSRDGYDRGAFAYLEVADTQRAVIDLQARLIAALKKFHEAQAVIDRLTGRWTKSDAAQEF